MLSFLLAMGSVEERWASFLGHLLECRALATEIDGSGLVWTAGLGGPFGGGGGGAAASVDFEICSGRGLRLQQWM